MSDTKYWKAVNHNGTTLGVFPSQQRAQNEAKLYTYMTGNPASVEEATFDEGVEHVSRTLGRLIGKD